MECKTMFEKITDEEERGQVGIGTLIVFIAMVLVAAIAAGVLINTAGFLQSSAEQSGQESQEQVTNRLAVQSTTGIVSGETVTQIEVNVKQAPGADDINLEEMSIRYLAADGAADLTYDSAASAGDSNFGLSIIKDDPNNEYTLDDTGDIMKITIDLAADPGTAAMDALEPGETAELEITTESGGSTTELISVPDSLSGSSAVDL
jgi:flagellin-like protein